MPWTQPRPAWSPRPCYCRGGRYPDDDPLQRIWWHQITSWCPTHWPPLPVAVKFRILILEGFTL